MEKEILNEIKESFLYSLPENKSKSSKKVERIRRLVKKHLSIHLGSEYEIVLQAKVKGKYIEKKVDIVVKKNAKILAAVGIKFHLSSFAKNANNHFENLLGITSNIHGQNCLYFHFTILLERMPNFSEKEKINKMEKINEKQLKAWDLSRDDSFTLFHMPIKSLLMLVEFNQNFPYPESNATKDLYIKHFAENDLSLSLVKLKLLTSDTVIINDYERWIEKIAYLIKGFS